MKDHPGAAASDWLTHKALCPVCRRGSMPCKIGDSIIEAASEAIARDMLHRRAGMRIVGPMALEEFLSLMNSKERRALLPLVRVWLGRDKTELPRLDLSLLTGILTAIELDALESFRRRLLV